VSRLLMVSHRADRSGAPIALLHLLRWLRERTNLEIEVLLWKEGVLEADFRALAHVEVVERTIAGRAGLIGKLANQLGPVAGERRRRSRLLSRYARRRDIDLVYFNSAASVVLDELASDPARAVVCAIHELKPAIEREDLERVTRLLRRADRVIAVANAVGDAVTACDPTLGERVEVVPGCIPVSELAPLAIRSATRARVLARLGADDDSLLALACGSPGPGKGTDLFVRAAQQVCASSKRPIHFVWLGGSSDSHALYAREAEQLGISRFVHFLESTPDPKPWFSSADCFLSPSREDAFPLVILEAAAAAVPIVCFDGSGGTSEFVDESCGRAVPYLDVDRFAEAVRELSDDEALRTRLGSEARRRVARDHDVDVGFAPVAEIITATLAARRRRP
jgi:glycosyltransferase involved in cell wall biosynthesis